MSYLDWELPTLCEPIGGDFSQLQGLSPMPVTFPLGPPLEADLDFTRMADTCQLLNWDLSGQDASLWPGSFCSDPSNSGASPSDLRGPGCTQAGLLQLSDVFPITYAGQDELHTSSCVVALQPAYLEAGSCATGSQGTPAGSDADGSVASPLTNRRGSQRSQRRQPAPVTVNSRPTKRATAEDTATKGNKRARKAFKGSALELPSHTGPSRLASEFCTTPAERQQALRAQQAQRSGGAMLTPFSVVKTLGSSGSMSLADLNARIQASAARAPGPLRFEAASRPGSCESGVSAPSSLGMSSLPADDGMKQMLPLRPLTSNISPCGSRLRTCGVTITPMPQRPI